MMKKGDTGGGNPVLLLILANFFVKFFGLLREVLIAAYYGTTDLTDAYLIAHSIPTIAFALIGSAIATTYIPMYSKVNSERDETSANTFTLHLLVVLLFFCLMISLLGELFTKNIVWIFAPGFSGEKLTITENFARILFPSVFAMTLFDLFGSYLQWHEKFRPIVLVPMIGNIVIIVSLYISSLFQNVYIFVWGTFWGLFSQVFFYLPWVSHTGLFSAPWGKIRSDTYLKQLLPLIIPVLIGTGANEINSIIDKSLVSSLDTGSVAALNFSYKIIYLVVGVLVAAIVTVMYPRMANLANEPDQKLFVKRCNSIIQLMFAVLFPVSCLIIIYKYEKIYWLGHLTLFKNNEKMNSLAMLDHKYPTATYRQAFSTPYNYHFIEGGAMRGIAKYSGCKCYEEIEFADISFRYFNFTLARGKDMDNPQIYRWKNGKAARLYLKDDNIVEEEVSYIHLQKRKMENKADSIDDGFLIVPNSFINTCEITKEFIVEHSQNTEEWKKWHRKFWRDYYIKTIKQGGVKIKLDKIIRKILYSKNV